MSQQSCGKRFTSEFSSQSEPKSKNDFPVFAKSFPDCHKLDWLTVTGNLLAVIGCYEAGLLVEEASKQSSKGPMVT